MHTPAAPPAATHHDRAYPGRPEQMRVLRADLRGLLRGSPVADDVILCASELAANAVSHSRSGVPGGHLTIRVEIHPGDYAWIEVEDCGGPWHHTAHSPERGHGLDIIRALAAEWGIDGDYRSRSVWARIDWPSQ